MTKPSPDRRTAISQSHLAQGACVLLAACGVALGVLGLPGTAADKAPDALTVPTVSPNLKAGDGGVVLVAVNEQGMADRMEMIGNKPVQPDAVPIDDGKIEAVAPPALPAESKYIGTLSLGAKFLAIMVDAGKQRVLKTGDLLADGSKVVGVTEAAVEVEASGGVKRSIPMAERTGEAISRATPAAPNPNGRGANNVAQAKAAALRMAQQNNKARPGGRHMPGTPDGSPERLAEIIDQMRSSGQYKDENSMMEAAKEIFQAEAAKAEKTGGEH